ncbi:MAG: hypothetical protein JST30_07665 [Armatimonadetes bacterium]|nr:hypothetical protein [Armatimonadota bacterium]
MNVGILLLGSSEYVGYLGESQGADKVAKLRTCLAIRTSHDRLAAYFSHESWIRQGTAVKLLDLFDSSQGMEATLEAVIDWRNSLPEPLESIVVYFIGHGQVYDREYYLLLKTSKHAEGKLTATALKATDLLSVLVRHLPRVHKHFIFDACYAGQVMTQAVAFPDTKDFADDNNATSLTVAASSGYLEPSRVLNGGTAFTTLLLNQLCDAWSFESVSLMATIEAIQDTVSELNRSVKSAFVRPLLRLQGSIAPPILFPQYRTPSRRSLQSLLQNTDLALGERIVRAFESISDEMPIAVQLRIMCTIVQLSALWARSEENPETTGINCNIMIPRKVTARWPMDDVKAGIREIYYPEPHLLNPPALHRKYSEALCLVQWADRYPHTPKGFTLLVDKDAQSVVFGAPACWKTLQEQPVNNIRKQRRKFGEGQSRQVAEAIEAYLIRQEYDSFHCFPILHKRSIYGILTVHCKKSPVFGRRGRQRDEALESIRKVSWMIGERISKYPRRELEEIV